MLGFFVLFCFLTFFPVAERSFYKTVMFLAFMVDFFCIMHILSSVLVLRDFLDFMLASNLGSVWHLRPTYSTLNVAWVACDPNVKAPLTSGPIRVDLWLSVHSRSHRESVLSVKDECVAHIWTAHVGHNWCWHFPPEGGCGQQRLLQLCQCLWVPNVF